MINLLLTLSLSAANIQPAQQSAQFRPCVWPNVCTSQPVQQTAQFRPCVWPNVCKTEETSQVLPVIELKADEAVAQFTTCQWPRKCGKTS
jgi:hypothetical protein